MPGKSAQIRKVLRRKNNGGKKNQPKTKTQRKNRGSRKLIRRSITQRGLTLSRMMIENERAKRQEGYEKRAAMFEGMAEKEREYHRQVREQIAAEKAAEAEQIRRIAARMKYDYLVYRENPMTFKPSS